MSSPRSKKRGRVLVAYWYALAFSRSTIGSVPWRAVHMPPTRATYGQSSCFAQRTVAAGSPIRFGQVVTGLAQSRRIPPPAPGPRFQGHLQPGHRDAGVHTQHCGWFLSRLLAFSASSACIVAPAVVNIRSLAFDTGVGRIDMAAPSKTSVGRFSIGPECGAGCTLGLPLSGHLLGRSMDPGLDLDEKFHKGETHFAIRCVLWIES
jgi:hypothetical protein